MLLPAFLRLLVLNLPCFTTILLVISGVMCLLISNNVTTSPASAAYLNCSFSTTVYQQPAVHLPQFVFATTISVDYCCIVPVLRYYTYEFCSIHLLFCTYVVTSLHAFSWTENNAYVALSAYLRYVTFVPSVGLLKG